MVFTKEQIRIFIISAIIGTIIYMLIYSKKGQERNAIGYFLALSHCFVLTVVSIFIVVGFGLIKVCLTQPLYAGLIVPLGWYMIAYLNVRKILNEDFGLNIHILNPEWKVIKLIKENTIIIPNIILLIGFSIATFMILFKALPDTANQPYGPIPVLLAGLIFLFATIGLAIFLYLNIRKIIKLVPSNQTTIKRKNTYEIVKHDKAEISKKDVKKAKLMLICAAIVFGLIFFMFVMLFLLVGIQEKNNSMLFIFGIVFMSIPVVLLLGNVLGNLKNNKLREIVDKIKIIFVGALFIGFATILYRTMCAGGNDFSILTAIQTSGFAIVFPLIFAGVGIMIIGSTIYLAIKDLMSK